MILAGLVLALVCATLTQADKSHLHPVGFILRKHSLVKPYLDNAVAMQNWIYSGSTAVVDDVIRLTPDRQSKRGGLWNTRPNTNDHWEALVHFKVHGSGKGNLFGDGFAFWYTQNPNEEGPVFGSRDYFTGLAVFFDTYNNNPHQRKRAYPYIHALVNDGTQSYEEQSGGNLENEIAGCQSFFRNSPHDTYVKIVYRMHALTVMVDVRGHNNWEVCFSVPGIQLPKGLFFGFSAATGHLADNHDIVSVTTSEGEPLTADERATFNQMTNRETFAGQQDKVHAELHGKYKEERLSTDDDGSGFGWFFYFFLLALFGGGAFAYKKFAGPSGEQYGKRYV